MQTYATRATGAPTTPSGTEIQPVNLALGVMFNPNLKSEWFTSAMQVINNIAMLSIILTGAAIISAVYFVISGVRFRKTLVVLQ